MSKIHENIVQGMLEHLGGIAGHVKNPFKFIKWNVVYGSASTVTTTKQNDTWTFPDVTATDGNNADGITTMNVPNKDVGQIFLFVGGVLSAIVDCRQNGAMWNVVSYTRTEGSEKIILDFEVQDGDELIWLFVT